MDNRLRFFINRILERLWVKPLAICILSVAAAFGARAVSSTGLEGSVPDIKAETVEKLLDILTDSMLVIAVFAVGSMVAAYSSASRTATPRSFPLVVADDVSQNALSTFVGAFIFGVVGQVALSNEYYGQAGRFALFLLTSFVFLLVIFNFIRWVDRLARLGRIGSTVDKVEKAAKEGLELRAKAPTMGGRRLVGKPEGQSIFPTAIGYVQRIEMAKLQRFAEEGGFRVAVQSLPGAFVTPSRVLASIEADDSSPVSDASVKKVLSAFLVGDDRTFDEDPRFGLVALSEIASRALSPAVNDPGTAIDVIGTQVRLFHAWVDASLESRDQDTPYDRIALPELSTEDMFDDAFSAIARDGASNIEVSIHLQKAFAALARLDDGRLRDAASKYARIALRHAESCMRLEEEKEALRACSEFARPE